MAYPLINGAPINGAAASGGQTTQGFMHTRYGTPTALVEAGESVEALVPSLGVLTKYGTPLALMPARTLVVPSLPRTLRFGIPTAVGQSVGPPLMSVSVASIGITTQFGTPVAVPLLAVIVEPIAPGGGFGIAGIGSGYTTAGFLTTQYGVPRASLIAHTVGVWSTRFGAISAQRIARAGSLSGLRFGTPRIAGAAGMSAEGFSSTTYGVPSMHRGARAMPAAPATRFGRPTLIRNSQC